MFRLQCLSGALDLAQDVFALGLPLVGLWVEVPLGQIALDVFDVLLAGCGETVVGRGCGYRGTSLLQITINRANRARMY